MAMKTNEHGTTEKFAGKAHEAVDRAAEAAARAEEYAREHAQQADERLRESAAYGRQKADDALDRVNGYVREKPLMSLGIAFLAGLLFSLLSRRR